MVLDAAVIHALILGHRHGRQARRQGVVGQMVAVHGMVGKVLCSGHDGVVGVRHGRVEGGPIDGLRQLMTEAHDDVFGVSAEDRMTCPRLGGQKLRESIGDLLVLGLLGRVGVDAGRRASGPRTTTIPRDDRLGTRSHQVRRPRTTVRRCDLGGLGSHA